MKSIIDEDGFIKITIPPGADEIQILNNEIKKIVSDEEHFTEANYPFTIKPNFSTLGSIIEISPQGPIIGFMFDDSIRDLLGFKAKTLYEVYNLSPNPVDIITIDKIFIETDICKGMTSRGKRSGIRMNYTMNLNPGYKYVERIHGGVQWFMMESEDVISSFSFELKSENNELVSFNGQSNTFHLSIKEI